MSLVFTKSLDRTPLNLQFELTGVGPPQPVDTQRIYPINKLLFGS